MVFTTFSHFERKCPLFWELSFEFNKFWDENWVLAEKLICCCECFVLWKLDPFLLPNDPWLPKKWIQPTHINSSLFSSAILNSRNTKKKEFILGLLAVKSKLNCFENEPICSINVTWIRQIDKWTVIQTHKTQIDHKPMRASQPKKVLHGYFYFNKRQTLDDA